MDNKIISNAIKKSQRCQRNWDLTQSISKEDLDTMITAVTECPSKQNETFYDITVVQDRTTIEDIHNVTEGFSLHDGTDNTIDKNGKLKPEVKCVTNSQTLANILFIFSKVNPKETRSQAAVALNIHNNKIDPIEAQRNLAIGIAAGYLNLSSSLMGYSTGCCCCFDNDKLSKIIYKRSPILIMGIGVRDKTRSRLEHHLDSNFRFPSFSKEISVDYL